MSAENTPLVSVIMPAYNSGRYIDEAIDSVLTQSYANLELVIINDGSTDNTAEVLSKYSSNSRIKLLESHNSGPAASRNACLRECSGTLIAYCDADDIWYPNKLEIQVPALLKNPEVILVHTARTAISSDGRNIGHKHKRSASDEIEIYNATKKLFARNYISGPSVLIRKECFEEIGTFNEKFELSSDHEFLLRASMKYSFGFLNKELHKYRKHDDQITANRAKREQYKERVISNFLEQYPDAISKSDINEAFATIHKSRANDCLKQDKDAASARAELRTALNYKPFNPSVWLRYLRTYI